MLLGAALVAAAVFSAPAPSATVVAAGDVASCDSDGDEQTAALVARIPGTVAVLGDSVYQRGTPEEFARLHGNDPTVAPFWNALYARGADVVLAGHDHHYERFAPLDPAGRVDRRRGLREFVVGTGGRSHYPTVRSVRGSERREWQTFGVLRLTLRLGRYDWRFLPVAGARFTDVGSGRCH